MVLKYKLWKGRLDLSGSEQRELSSSFHTEIKTCRFHETLGTFLNNSGNTLFSKRSILNGLTRLVRFITSTSYHFFLLVKSSHTEGGIKPERVCE
jgi:hypothetical protein